MVQRRVQHDTTGDNDETTGEPVPSRSEVVIVGTLNTLVGPITAVLTSRGVGHLSIGPDAPRACSAWLRRWMPTARIASTANELAVLEAELTAYFAGERTTFTTPTDLRGTIFQTKVWQAVQHIRYGEVSSYGQVALTLGHPRAARAVGAANGANPVPILVPCHRLVGHNGALISYRGGVAMKRHLLQLEGVLNASDTVVSS